MKIAPDKWKHFFVGIIMGLVFQFTAHLIFPTNLLWVTSISGGLIIAISYGFELFSKITGLGHYDIIDAVASIIGGLTGVLPVFIYQYQHA